MTSLALLLACLTLLVWIVLTFFRGVFWHLRRFDMDLLPEQEAPRWPSVVAVVPARNEAETIARCVESLCRQKYPGEFRIFVIDDHSTDETAALALEAAQKAMAADRAEIIKALELEPGWTGKLWALQQGINAAKNAAPQYFWFTDADIVHASDTLRRLMGYAEHGGHELTSLMVLLQARTFPERLLIPAFLYFFLMLYPPEWIAESSSNTAGAAGGCILLQRAALKRIGGIEAVRGEVIDDCALARAVKRSGGRIWMGITRKSVSLRTYSTFGEIRDLIARTAFTQLRYSWVVLLGTILGLVLTYFVPVILTFHPQAMVWRVSLVAWVMMTFTFLPTVRFYGLSPLWAPLLPFSALFYCYATCLSAVRYWLGRGGQWKGRAQAPAKT
ncbi:MAG TPA: glycosyltransferase [Candidatus Acidoferrum sp.]|nr:glycosyltransferase [Candidatus Acidoferrum sp.]